MKKYLTLNIQMFGASNSNSTTLSSSAGNKATLVASFVENDTSVADNTSNITVSGSLTMTSGSFSVSSSPTLSIYWHDNHTNQDVYVNSKVIQSLGAKAGDSVSGTINVTHNDDGTLAGYSYSVWSYSGSTTYVPASGSVGTPATALTTIPRASTISTSSTDIGSKPTFTIARASDTFTHTIKYSFGSLSDTIATGVGTSYNNWTIPSTFYTQIPNATSGDATITCETYNGNTLIGTSTCTLNVTVPSTAKPNISNPTIVDTDTVSKNTIKLYVVGKSKLKFTFPAFSTNYSSTLQSYTLKINNQQVYSGTSTTYTMPTPLTLPGNTYSLTITDSRGISNTTGNVNLSLAYAYTEPKITFFSVERDDTTPTTVNIKYSGSITNVNNNNKNAKSFKIEYRQLNASSWTTVTTATDAYTKTNVSVNKTGISDSNSFEFRITAVDSYNIPATATAQIGTSATLINFSADGTAIAFGKASETASTFECDLNSKFTKDATFTKYLIPEGGIKGRTLSGGSGTTGYMNCFSITTTGNYQNQALKFDVLQRGRSAKVRIILNSSATQGAISVNSFQKEGNSNLYYTVSNNVLTVYVQKSEAYDSIEIVNLRRGSYMNNTIITWNNTTVSSLPTGYSTVSNRVGEFAYGVTSTVGNNSSSNLMTSAGVYNSINPLRNCIEVAVANRYDIATTAWADYKIPLNQVRASYGTLLTTSNDGIKIGAGISCVLVTLSVCFSSATPNYEHDIKIYKNHSSGSNVQGTFTSYYGGLKTTVLTQIFNVEQNDEILGYFDYASNANCTIYESSYMTVTVIA